MRSTLGTLLTMGLFVMPFQSAAYTPSTSCFDKVDATFRMGVATYGETEAFRAFFSAPVNAAKVDAAGAFQGTESDMTPLSRLVILHCPTGQSVEVTGFSFSFADNGAEIEKGAPRLGELTQSLFARAEPFKMDELVGYFEQAGYAAEYNRGALSSCACEM